jgi:hypothetical protein
MTRTEGSVSRAGRGRRDEEQARAGGQAGNAKGRKGISPLSHPHHVLDVFRNGQSVGRRIEAAKILECRRVEDKWRRGDDVGGEYKAGTAAAAAAVE